MMVKKLSIKIGLAAIVLFLSILSIVKGQTASQIAQRCYSSVVLLVMEDSNGQPLSFGSGFFVKQNIVATNFHVIEGAARGYAKIVGKKTKYDVEGIAGIDTKRDLVLLKITRVKALPLSFGDGGQVAVGDEVYVIGNPMGLEGTFSKGIVSGIRQVEADTLFQITAPISPGSSGGPVLNIKGEVIGVAAAAFRGGQNLNFAIPSSYLVALLSKVTSVVSLSAKTLMKQQKSILDGFGGGGVEGVTAGKMMWTWKYHGPLAGRYSFSIQNNLREAVKDVRCLVVFYDKTDNPIEVDMMRFPGVILGGLATRVISSVHESVQELTTPNYSKIPQTRIEFRVLDFKIVK